MNKYQAIQQRIHGFVPKSCWIAHILSDHGLTTRQSANRIDPDIRQHPCPPEKRDTIENVMRALHIL